MKNNVVPIDEQVSKLLEKSLQANAATLSHSGNSDVDITIHVDTKPIAFAMLYSLLATKQLSNEEFEKAVRRLDSLKSNYEKPRSMRNYSTPKLYEGRNGR